MKSEKRPQKFHIDDASLPRSGNVSAVFSGLRRAHVLVAVLLQSKQTRQESRYDMFLSTPAIAFST